MAEESKKSLNEDMLESAHKIWLAGLGALSAAGDEGSKIFSSLVEKGESLESRGKKQVDKTREVLEGAAGKAGSSWEKLGDAFDEKVEAAIERLGVPTRDEINVLTKRVEELTHKIDSLKTSGKKSG